MTHIGSDFTLYYWGVQGRGQFMRYMFEHKGVPYNEINDVQQMTEIMYCKGVPKDTSITPMFAPPILKHRDVYISQTPNVMRYIATKIGLLPKTEQDQFLAQSILLNSKDLFQDCWDNAKDEETFVKFLTSRFVLWMTLMSNQLGKNKYFFDQVTYVDFHFYHVMNFLKTRLGKKYDEYVTKKFPKLDAYRQRMDKVKGVDTVQKKNIKGFDPFVWKN